MTSDQQNPKAVTALVLGIVGLFIPFLGVILLILAIVFGALGLKKSKELGGYKREMAIAGMVIGIVGLVLLILIIIITIYYRNIILSGA